MAGLTEIKANSASQQSWSCSWGLAELGNNDNDVDDEEDYIMYHSVCHISHHIK